MGDEERLKKLVIAKCENIVRAGNVRAYKWMNTYTVKDKITSDTIFEIKSAEYCDTDNGTQSGCECLIVNKRKFLVSNEANRLLLLTKDLYERNSQEIPKPKNLAKKTEEDILLEFLDKYTRE